MKIKLRNLIQTAILLVGINSAIIYSNIIGYENIYNLFDVFSKLLLALSIYISIQLVVKSIWKTHVLLGLIYFFSFTAELFNLTILKQYISFDNLKAVYHTNLNEANEFVASLLSNLWLPLFIIIILIINIIYLPKDKISLTYHKIYFIIIPVGLLLPFLNQFIRTIDSPLYFENIHFVSYSIDRVLKTPPTNIYYRSYQVFANVKRLNKTKALRDNFKFGVLDINSNSPSKVILIVGEGMRSLNWSINGYYKLTNPNLDTIGNLITFKQHYSNANNTYKSIPLIITKATPQNPTIAFSEKSIISLFKEAGYHTLWISNQDIFFLDNQKEPDSTIFTYKPRVSTDLAVINPFQHIISKTKEEKLFVLINLVGNHGKTPDPFNDHFKPNSNNTFSETLPENKEKLVNDYDNKILFQDYVLSKIINIIQETNESAVVLFTADHGLNLFDNSETNVFGYGSDNPTQYELHIPFLIWCSDSYIATHKNKFNNLLRNSDACSDNDDVIYTLSDLSDINFKDFESNKSLSSEQYVSKTIIPVNINEGYVFFNPKNQ